MNKKLLVVSALALLTPSLLAQDLVVKNAQRKWDGAFDGLIASQSVQRTPASNGAPVSKETLSGVTINVTGGAADLVEYIKGEGYEAEEITDKCLVAQIPAKFVPVLAERSDVVYIAADVQHHLLMKNAREMTNADDVQAGTGLDTPFDGSGVVVGIIDQGFQYDHLAFKGHASYFSGLKFSTTLPTTGDQYSTSAHGHATHVANIAAGAKVKDCEYYGMAPAAELLLCSSDFSDSNVLTRAKAIKKYAEEAGKPWVLNMSFGGHLGPHDGSSSSSQNMDALCGAGGIMVAAAGNERADKIHAMAEFDEDDEVKSVYIKPGSSNSVKGFMLDLWAMSDNGQKELTIQPILKTSSKEYVPTTTQLRNSGFSVTEEVNALNNKQHYRLTGYISNLAQTLGVSSTSTYYFVIKVTGKKGNGYHAWLNSTTDNTTCEFGTSLSSLSSYKIQKPSESYLVGEGAACNPKTLAVASYNAATSFRALSGSTYTASLGKVGGISNFSSPGPSINTAHVKPIVAAPGGCILSAFNSSDTYVKDNATDVVAKITSGSKSYYYGEMSGTSMASPAMTGIVALWLQANPNLTPENVEEIIRTTSIQDTYTGTMNEEGWNADFGYGKVDAYAGLKKAIEMGKSSGIAQAMNTTAPVSLQKGTSNWKVLFNNDETFATIEIVGMNGQVVSSKRIESPRRGEEEVVDLSAYAPGVYVVNIKTTAASISRKLVR